MARTAAASDRDDSQTASVVRLVEHGRLPRRDRRRWAPAGRLSVQPKFGRRRGHEELVIARVEYAPHLHLPQTRRDQQRDTVAITVDLGRHAADDGRDLVGLNLGLRQVDEGARRQAQRVDVSDDGPPVGEVGRRLRYRSETGAVRSRSSRRQVEPDRHLARCAGLVAEVLA
jgi:hypothetical protein